MTRSVIQTAVIMHLLHAAAPLSIAADAPMAPVCTPGELASGDARRCADVYLRVVTGCLKRGIPLDSCDLSATYTSCATLSPGCSVPEAVADLVRVIYLGSATSNDCGVALLKAAGKSLQARLVPPTMKTSRKNARILERILTKPPAQCAESPPALHGPCAQATSGEDAALCLLRRAAGCVQVQLSDIQYLAAKTLEAATASGWVPDPTGLSCTDLVTAEPTVVLGLTRPAGAGVEHAFFVTLASYPIVPLLASFEQGQLVVSNEMGGLRLGSDGAVVPLDRGAEAARRALSTQESFLCDDAWLNPTCTLLVAFKDVAACGLLVSKLPFWRDPPKGAGTGTPRNPLIFKGGFKSCADVLRGAFLGQIQQCQLPHPSEGQSCTPPTAFPCGSGVCRKGLCLASADPQAEGTACTPLVATGLVQCAGYKCRAGSCVSEGYKPAGTTCAGYGWTETPRCDGPTILVKGNGCRGDSAFCDGDRRLDCSSMRFCFLGDAGCVQGLCLSRAEGEDVCSIPPDRALRGFAIGCIAADGQNPRRLLCTGSYSCGVPFIGEVAEAVGNLCPGLGAGCFGTDLCRLPLNLDNYELP